MRVNNTEYMCENERQVNGAMKMQGEEVAKVDNFKYLGSTVQRNGVRKRSEEESTGRMEWVEKNVRSDLRQASTS